VPVPELEAGDHGNGLLLGRLGRPAASEKLAPVRAAASLPGNGRAAALKVWLR